jgi:hypothetical protein
MTTSNRPTRTLDELEKLLAAQHEVYRALLHAVERKREAIRTAAVETVIEISGKEEVIVGRLEAMDGQRRQLLARVSAEMGERTGESLTVRQIAERLDEPTRTRLLALAAQLRETILALRRESSVVRTGAEALGRHMGGIIQSMQTAISKAAVYGRRGRIAAATQIPCSVDVRS